MKKFFYWLGVTLFVLLLGLAIFYPDIEVTMTEKEVNEQVSKMLPYSKKMELEFKGISHPVNLKAMNSKIKFMEDGRISIYSDFNIVKEKTSARGSIEIISGIHYENTESAFYAYESELKKINIENLNISNEDKKLAKNEANDIKDKVKNKVSKFKGFLKENLSDKTFNKIETASNNAKNKIIKDLSENRELYLNTAKEISKAGMTAIFENIPLYSLDNTDVKQKLASMALKDVYVENGTITVVFSIAKFLSSLLLYVIAGGLMIVLVVAGIKDPEVFVILAKTY